ncbi:metallophosphoesterase [Aminobacter sp. BA135]|uniref:metallophosphoesterase family protein n=1 Tax=Aminobacter sp. BA135 TaxID=537596 RepID=UPI003D79F119
MRIAVIADIHGNILALEAVIADLARRGGADVVVNLGDLVSGPLWPSETAETLQALGWPTVRGNHDRRVATDPLSDMGPSDRFAYDRLTPAQRGWMEAMPLTLEIAPSVLAFHARPDHDERYLSEVIDEGQLIRAPLKVIESRLRQVDPKYRLLLAGHSHRADLVQLSGGRLLFNPGSVGAPAYDDDTVPAHVSEQGSPLARYGLVELDAAGIVTSVDALAVTYDYEAAAHRAVEGGRPEWAHALRTGFMPD